MRKKIIVSFLLSISNFAFSQVGINTNEPNTNTLLHVSEKLKASNSSADNAKGIIIPRLKETERDQLTSNIKSTQEEQDNNSLMIFNTDENCYNYWNNEDKAWKSLCGTTGNSTFTYSCGTDITLHGNYTVDTETTSNEYIAIDVEVTKIGDYFVTASSTDDDGYSFVGSGTFTSIGAKTIYLYAQGTPKKTTYKDDGTNEPNKFLISSFNINTDEQENCTVNITVQLAKARYTINCLSTTVNGTYHKGEALNLTDNNINTITLTVKVYTKGSYYITTNTVKGVAFSAKGKFEETGTKTVTLIGSGKPTTNNDFDVTITSNTADGNATCTATIPITIPTMTVYIIGKSDYSWFASYRTNGLKKDGVFGPTGKVKIDKINYNTNSVNTSTATTYLNAGNKPDVILYYAYNAEPDEELSKALANYTKSGGILVYGTSDDTQVQANILLKGIYGKTNPPVAYNAKEVTNPSTNDYQINNLPEDPIINGPFGNLAGKFWGEDNGGSVFVRNLPSTAVQIASAHNYADNKTIPPDDSIIWYDTFHNFAYVGDSVGARDDSYSSNIWYAAIFNKRTALPKSKLYGYWNSYSSTSSGQQYVYNAAIDYNLLAWALKRAAEIGINKH